MTSRVPQHLQDEERAVEDHIRRAFRGVTRVGGTSWSASVIADNYGSDEEMEAAAAQDTEQTWEELVDDPAWIHEPGIGGFSFLDPIGFRYYIAPAIIRCAREGYGEFTNYALTIDSEFNRKMIEAVTPVQSRAIAHFLRYMIAVDAADSVKVRHDPAWRNAYDMYWRQFDDGASVA